MIARERINHRIVQDCRATRLFSGWPDSIPRPRSKGGAKGKGISYEKVIGRALSRLLPVRVVSGQWWSYDDTAGRFFCQTDHYAEYADQVLLVECKLTETYVGFSQIDFLYRPVLERYFQKPITGVMACRHLTTRENPRLIHDIADALERPGANFVWHYLG